MLVLGEISKIAHTSHHINHDAVFLDRGLQQFLGVSHGTVFFFFKTVQTPLVEVGDEGTLMSLQHEFGHELANALNVEKLHYVDFVCKHLTCSFVSLQLFDPSLVPATAFAGTATADGSQQDSQQVFRVVVKVFAALNDFEHH